MQTESQSPAMQLQPTNIAQCHPASTVQLQGQQIARPNGYQNQLLEQNVWDCVQHLLPTVQQELFWITQQQVGMHMQRYQMLGANVGKINTGYSGGWNNQQNAGWASGIQSPSKYAGRPTWILIQYLLLRVRLLSISKAICTVHCRHMKASAKRGKTLSQHLLARKPIVTNRKEEQALVSHTNHLEYCSFR